MSTREPVREAPHLHIKCHIPDRVIFLTFIKTVAMVRDRIDINILQCLKKRGPMQPSGSIFIADNDRKSRDLISAFLTYQGYDIVPGSGKASIFDTIQEQR